MNIRIGAKGVMAEGELIDSAPVPLDDMPLQLLEDPVVMQQAKECAFSAINDGFTHIVYNFVRSGQSQLTDRDICTFKGFDLEKIWEEFSSQNSLPKF